MRMGSGVDFGGVSGTVDRSHLPTLAGLLHNLAASVPPEVTDDSSGGYGVGSLWFDTTADVVWQALDVSVGTAVWKMLTDYYPYEATNLESYPRVICSGAGGMATGRAYFDIFTARKTLTFSKIVCHTDTTIGVSPTLCRLGLATVDDSDNILLVARIASDTTVGGIANTSYERALDTTGGFPASYTIQAGKRYAHSFIWVGAGAAPTFVGRPGPRGGTGIQTATSPKMGGYVASQTDIPTTTQTLAALVSAGAGIWIEYKP